MKSNIIFIICITTLVQTSEAIEYIFLLESGYTLKINTPDQVDLQSAIATGQALHVTLVSNNPEQKQLDQNSGFSLTSSLLPEVIHRHQQYLQGQIVHTQTVRLQQVQFLHAVPVIQAQALTQNSHNTATSSPVSRSKSGEHRVCLNKSVCPCSYPGCEIQFPQHVARAEHHRSHFTSDFLESLNKGNKVPCPICGRLFVGTLSAIMIHIAHSHNQK